MRPLLYIAYTFPPVSTGSAPMNLKLSALFVENGWAPWVVTPEHAGGMPLDPTLVEHLPKEVRVVRRGRVMRRTPGAPGPGTTPKVRGALGQALRRFVLETLLQPDRYVTWLPSAVRASMGAFRESRAEMVITLGPPHSVHLAGLILSLLTRKPWVAWFGDLWLADGYVDWKALSPFRRFWSRIGERLVVRRADGIVTTTEGSSASFRRVYGRTCPPVHTQWNGVTRREAELLWNPDPPPPLGNELVVTYAGFFMGNQTPEYFLGGMKHYLEKYPLRKVRLRIVGDPGTCPALARRMGLEASVEFPGRVSYHQVRQWRETSHLLLILLPPQAGNELKNAAKTAECLLSRRPILAVAPEGDMGGLIRSLEAGYLSGHDPEQVCAALEAAFDDLSSGRHRVLETPEALWNGPMDMEASMRQTVQFLEGILRRSSTP